MDINGWLTVITVFTAIFALLPKEDLKMYRYKISIFEQVLVGLILIFILPFLIFFDKLIERFPFLSDFTFERGIMPSNLAFLFFFISFVWLLYRFFLSDSKVKASNGAISYFKEMLIEKSFEDFFVFFKRHTSPQTVSANWELYRSIVMHPKFLNGVFPNHTGYLFEIWERFEYNDDFKIVFKLFLQNRDSDYYREIRLHYNTHSLREDSPFLNLIIKRRGSEALGSGLLDILVDHINEHLRGESSSDSIYNQTHIYTRVREDQGFNLPLYYHIRFFGLLYSFSIESKSASGPRMMTFFSSVAERIVSNLRSVDSSVVDSKSDTNFHWLLEEICDIINHWADSFGKEYFVSESEHNGRIPAMCHFFMKTLYDGCSSGKIGLNFLANRLYYGILNAYFDPRVNGVFKGHIEREVIGEIPVLYIPRIFDFALNEKFARSYDDVMGGNYGYDVRVNEILKRLKEFLEVVWSRDQIVLGYLRDKS